MSSNKRYQVGYGRPPVASRFQKGRSGNPGGRPKNLGNVKADIERMLLKGVKVREIGTTRFVPAIVAVFARALNEALQGRPKALLDILKVFHSAGLLKLDDLESSVQKFIRTTEVTVNLVGSKDPDKDVGSHLLRQRRRD